MEQISIISSSVSRRRNSHRVALFLHNYIAENNIAKVEIIDLKQYNFPVFDDRLRFQKDPSEQIISLTGKINSSAGIIIVTPEYNGGIPASLKNVIDLLYDEWHRKPIALATVSNGPFGGSQALVTLQFVLWKMHAWTVPPGLQIANVKKNFSENGETINAEILRRVTGFVNELRWCITANMQMEESFGLLKT
jgi:NAD(P)H-dependent FMN reductase